MWKALVSWVVCCTVMGTRVSTKGLWRGLMLPNACDRFGTLCHRRPWAWGQEQSRMVWAFMECTRPAPDQSVWLCIYVPHCSTYKMGIKMDFSVLLLLVLCSVEKGLFSTSWILFTHSQLDTILIQVKSRYYSALFCNPKTSCSILAFFIYCGIQIRPFLYDSIVINNYNCKNVLIFFHTQYGTIIVKSSLIYWQRRGRLGSVPAKWFFF